MISYHKKVLFIHIGKNGGNSITKALVDHCPDLTITKKHSVQDGVNRFEPVSAGMDIPKHASLTEYVKLDPNLSLSEFYKFCCVRNPFDRLVSAYFSPHRVLKFGDKFDYYQFKELILSQRTLRQFICLTDSDELDAHMDTILRFERLKEDFNVVRERLGIEAQLPFLNRGNRDHYQNYYDRHLKELVMDKFSEEINFFEYEF